MQKLLTLTAVTKVLELNNRMQAFSISLLLRIMSKQRLLYFTRLERSILLLVRDSMVIS